MVINQKQRFHMTRGLGIRIRESLEKIKLGKFLVTLLVFLFLLFSSFSSLCYAMPQSILRQPGQGSSYWVLGDLYTLKATGEETGKSYALTEILVQPQSATPPHIHHREDEAFYIQEGKVEFQLGDRTIVATPGTFLHSPKGQLHSFKNISSKPAKMLCWVTPAGLEQFFAEVGVPLEERSPSPPAVSPADIETIMATAPKYGLEIIPPPSPQA